MCCQITPAMGIEPMKPITTIRFRFIKKKTPNSERIREQAAQRRMSNLQRWKLDVGCSTLDVRRFLRSLEFFNNDGRISRNDCIRLNPLCDNGARSDNRVLANRDALQNHSIHSDPNVVRDLNRSGL